jgi:hypothetical protein
MSTNELPDSGGPAADTPQPDSMLTPEEVVAQLRMLRSRMAVTPMTARQRKAVRDRTRLQDSVVQGSINVIGSLDRVEQALGQPADAVRQLLDETNRWTAVEDELRALLNGVVGENLVRRQTAALLASQAYGVGKSLARDPENSVLIPHLQEIKRLKRIARRKKAAPAP